MRSSIYRPLLVALSFTLILAACTSHRGGGGGGGGDDDDDSAGPGDIPGQGDECSSEGSTSCFGPNFMRCTNGFWELVETCVEPAATCHLTLGCIVCNPGVDYCIDNEVWSCNGDGTEASFVEECPPGDWCAGGACVEACSVASSTFSYLGCDFLAVSTTNTVDPIFDLNFAVVIGNPASNPAASVTVQRGGSTVATQTIAPGQTSAITLPMVPELKLATQSVTSMSAAYEVTSSVPVAAYQYNPLNYEVAGVYSYSNDASLLLPEHTLTGSYMVSAFPTFGVNVIDDAFGSSAFGAYLPGFLAVAATTDGTEVTIRVTGDTSGGSPGALSGGQETTVLLNRGDVVQVLSDYETVPPTTSNHCSSMGWEQESRPCPQDTMPGYTCQYCLVPNSDLTGSTITATAPVAVFSGHQCSFMPFDDWACDHLEEMMFPTPTWGTRSVMTAPAHPDTTGAVAPTVYRVLAQLDGTEVSFTPAVYPTTTLAAGGFLEFESDQDFVVEGTGRIHVTQALFGQNHLDSTIGDPAMGSGIPWVQVRDVYDFLTPDTFTRNFVNVVAPSGTTVELDGSPLGGWQDIGTTGFVVARVQVSPGSHHIRSTGQVGFGITAYGYAEYTSYLYPGGMNFAR